MLPLHDKYFTKSEDILRNSDGCSSSSGHDEGFYTLLLNKLHFFISMNGNLMFSNSFHIELFEENRLVFEPTSRSDNNLPNPNVVCEKV